MSNAENALEAAAIRARDEPAMRPEFYRQLMGSVLLVPGYFGEGTEKASLKLAVVRQGDKELHPIFSSATRLEVFRPQDSRHVHTPARDLFQLTTGASFVLNPGWEYGKELAADEIAYWLKASSTPGPQRRPPVSYIVQPDPYPAVLVQALSALFVNRQVRAAYLTQTEYADPTTPPRLVIGVETHTDWRKLAMEMATSVQAASPTMPVDLVQIERDKPKSPVIEALLKVPPFYLRSIFNA